jgi:acetyl-CoA acetyltransferase
MTTRRAAIVAPMRTPVGVFGGSPRDVPVEELAATAIEAVLAPADVDPERIEDVAFSQSYVNGETLCVGRWAALPVSVPGFQRGDPVTVSRDEGVRQDSTPESLAKLRTIMPGGRVTAAPGRRHRGADPRHRPARTARRDGRYLLQTMCVGGGQGVAAVLEGAR